MDWNNLVNFINALPDRDKKAMNLSVSEDKINYGYSKELYCLQKKQFESENKSDCQFYSDEIYYSTEDTLEIPIDTRGQYWSSRVHSDLKDRLMCSNVKEEIEYKIKSMSLAFIIEIFNFFNSNDLRLPNRVPNRRPFDLGTEDLKEYSLSEFLQISYRLPDVLCVSSKTKKDITYLETLANSYFFDIAINFGYVFKRYFTIEELFPYMIPTIRSGRTSSLEDIQAPQRKYNSDLTSQYFMAMSSNDPFIEFLCYYHVIEHFFEQVYKEDIIKSVQEQITSPIFSAKREKDIVKLMDNIKNKMISNREGNVNEGEALILTIRKYIPNLEDLKENISEINSELLGYYRDREVSFSKGDTFDLTSNFDDKIYRKIANRIYKTRNSIVHSKSNEFKSKNQGIYVPFKDEKELGKEIPLIKLIAESIIIKSSKIIK